MNKLDKSLYIELGKQLKEARQKKKYSLSEVADLVGKSKVSIKRYEDAKVRVDMDTLEKLCKVLDIKTLDYSSLIYGDNEDRPIIEGAPDVLDGIIEISSAYADIERKWRKLEAELFNHFMESEKETQIAIMTLLKMDNIVETMEFIHKMDGKESISGQRLVIKKVIDD